MLGNLIAIYGRRHAGSEGKLGVAVYLDLCHIVVTKLNLVAGIDDGICTDGSGVGQVS